jgi:hypothetical protein
MHPTLPGIGLDGEPISSIQIPVSVAAASAPKTQDVPSTIRDVEMTSRDPVPATVREAEIEELDPSSLVLDEVPATTRDIETTHRSVERVAPPPPPPSSRPVPAPVAAVPIVAPVVVPEPFVPPAPVLGAVAPRQSMPVPTASSVPAPVPFVPPAPAQAAVPFVAPVQAPVQVIAPVAHVAPFVPQVAPMKSPAIMTPMPMRPSLSDPMDVLFDAAYDLCFLESAVQGAQHCMVSGMSAIGSCQALVHLFDGATGQYVTVAGHGPGTDQQVLSRHEDDDWLLSAAIFKGKPITMEYGGEVSSTPLPRHAALGVTKNVVVVPVIAWGRALAVIEIVDASESALAGGRGENALAYLAQRLAEFLGEHEIVLGTAC